MKYFIYSTLGFIFLAVFFPFPLKENGVVKFRNAPLLIGLVACVLLYLLYLFIRSVVFAIKVKSVLKRNGIRNIKMRFGLVGGRGHNRIIATDGKHIYNILLLFKRGIGWRYHFKDKYTLEFYKKIRINFENSKIVGPIVSKLVETKFMGKKILRWKDDELGESVVNILIIDREPYLTSDSESGEKIITPELASGILFFDLNSFSKNAHQYLL